VTERGVRSEEEREREREREREGISSSSSRPAPAMSSIGTSKGVLEIAKFGVYVSVPVALTYLVATDSKTLKKLMGLVISLSLSLSS
jgi:hypothetical protein